MKKLLSIYLLLTLVSCSTTTDESKEEIWTYAKHSYQNERNSFGVDALGLLIPSPLDFMWVDASTSKSETSTKTLSVTIRFDKNKIVRSYKISQSRV